MSLLGSRFATADGRSPSRARWFYPCALAVMVVLASGRSQVAAPPIVDIDKLVHFSVFGLLATLVVRSPGLPRVWPAALLVSLFGIADEFRQSFTPGRSVEVADWLADTGGACLAVALYAFWPWYRRLLETPLRLRRRRVVPPAAATHVSSSSVPVA